MVTARRLLIFIFAAFVLFNVVMIPALLLRVEEGFRDCFTLNFGDCGAAISSIWVSWRIYRWINLVFLIGLFVAFLVALALYARGRREGPQLPVREVAPPPEPQTFDDVY